MRRVKTASINKGAYMTARLTGFSIFILLKILILSGPLFAGPERHSKVEGSKPSFSPNFRGESFKMAKPVTSIVPWRVAFDEKYGPVTETLGTSVGYQRDVDYLTELRNSLSDLKLKIEAKFPNWTESYVLHHMEEIPGRDFILLLLAQLDSLLDVLEFTFTSHYVELSLMDKKCLSYASHVEKLQNDACSLPEAEKVLGRSKASWQELKALQDDILVLELFEKRFLSMVHEKMGSASGSISSKLIREQVLTHLENLEECNEFPKFLVRFFKINSEFDRRHAEETLGDFEVKLKSLLVLKQRKEESIKAKIADFRSRSEALLLWESELPVKASPKLAKKKKMPGSRPKLFKDSLMNKASSSPLEEASSLADEEGVELGSEGHQGGAALAFKLRPESERPRSTLRLPRINQMALKQGSMQTLGNESLYYIESNLKQTAVSMWPLKFYRRSTAGLSPHITIAFARWDREQVFHITLNGLKHFFKIQIRVEGVTQVFEPNYQGTRDDRSRDPMAYFDFLNVADSSTQDTVMEMLSDFFAFLNSDRAKRTEAEHSSRWIAKG